MDGWVYCLRTTDGALVWRYRGTSQRRIIAYDNLESAWPVHGSVLIKDDTLYFTAGRSSFLDGGIHVYVLDPASGGVIRKSRIAAEPVQNSKQPRWAPKGVVSDLLVTDGTETFLRNAKLPSETLEAEYTMWSRSGAKSQHIISTAGLLEDSMFNRTLWRLGNLQNVHMLVFNDTVTCGFKAGTQNSWHDTQFLDGSSQYQLRVYEKKKLRWSKNVPIRIQSMLLAGDTLFYAGASGRVDTEDPLAAFEGRSKGVLCSVSVNDEENTVEYEIASPPVWDGMAAAESHLYLSLKNGNVICYEQDDK